MDFARAALVLHIAVNPASLSADDLDPAVVEKEKSIQMGIVGAKAA
jgi:translation elongation factor EF-Ts